MKPIATLVCSASEVLACSVDQLHNMAICHYHNHGHESRGAPATGAPLPLLSLHRSVISLHTNLS